MTTISVQASVYGLGGTDTPAAIAAFVQALDDHGLRYEMGSMSTVAWGDREEIWHALEEGYAAVSDLGPSVMQVTISNACPLPDLGEESA